jgi:hypothetical protein
MISNQFSIVPCSFCPGRTLMKTALIWKADVFCSADCLRDRINKQRVHNEHQLKQARDKFFNTAL